MAVRARSNAWHDIRRAESPKTPGRVAGPTRKLGADTEAVLAELGLDRDACGL